MHVVANPNADTFLLDKGRAEGFFLQIGAFEIGAEARITLAQSAKVGAETPLRHTEDFGLSSNPRTSSRARDLMLELEIRNEDN
jgi:hypothetical protein